MRIDGGHCGSFRSASFCLNRKETLTVVGVMALLGESSDVRKVCVTVILFMTVTVLLTHPDAIPLQRWLVSSSPGKTCFCRYSLKLVSCTYLTISVLSRCKRIGVQLKVG